MSDQNQKSRAPLVLTLIAAGIFMIAVVLLPLLVRGQKTALDDSGIVRPPVIMDQAAPQLALTDSQGNLVSLDNYLGKVVLVNNWTTWCPPCKAEMPEFQAYFQAHTKQGFVIIAIDSREPADTVANSIRQLGLTFPVWLDLDGVAVGAFKNLDFPSSYVVDQQGILRMNWTGSINQATLEKYVTPLLEK